MYPLRKSVARRHGVVLLLVVVVCTLTRQNSPFSLGGEPIPWARFESIVRAHRNPVVDAYEGLPLSDLPQQMRMEALTTITREVHEGLCSSAFFNCSGTEDGFHNTSVWSVDGQRVLCKTSQLYWQKSRGVWYANWSAVGAGSQFDLLLLTLWTPCGMFIYKHDGVSGTHRNDNLRLQALCRDERSAFATARIVERLDGLPGCMRVACGRVDDALVLQAQARFSISVAASCYDDVPMQEFSGSKRAHVLKDILRCIDEDLHRSACFDNASNFKVNGYKQASSSNYDWKRNDVRVACRSSTCFFAKAHDTWKLTFDIKEACYDELLLACYTPRGIYVYRHYGEFGRGSKGGLIQISMRGTADGWASALDTMLARLDDESNGCLQLAFIPFDCDAKTQKSIPAAHSEVQ